MNHIRLKQLLFIDIETVPIQANYESLPSAMQKLFANKIKHYKTDLTIEELYTQKAGILAEFGKIVCIGLGYLAGKRDNYQMRVTAVANENEKVLLKAFLKLLNKSFNNVNQFCFCGHNIKEFDIPYICRRILINALPLPEVLNISGLKPWEVNHVDTLNLWKFGDRKHYTSVSLLAHLLKVPTPKSDIDGSDVATVYWEQNDLERIIRYCKKDVIAVAQLIMRFKQLPLLKEEQIIVL